MPQDFLFSARTHRRCYYTGMSVTTYAYFIKVCKGLADTPHEQAKKVQNKIYNFMHQKSFKEMPLYINDEIWGIYAKWRLKIGK